MILVKNCKFPFCLFWDKMGLEVVLDDYVVTKLCKTKLCTSNSSHIYNFFTRVKPCFGQKLEASS